ISVFKSDISNVFHQNNMPSLLMVFSPILILYPISQSCKAIFQSQGKTAPFVISHHVLPGLGSLFVFITLSSILNPYLATISYWLSFSLLQTVLYSSYLLKEGYIAQFLWPLKINTSVLLDLWEFSWPVLLSNTDLIMIGYFLSTDEVGLYKAIQPFRGVVIFVLASFTYSLFPLMSAYIEDDQENKLSDIYRTSTKWITLTTLPIVATIGFFSEGIIMVFLTNSYQDAALVLSVLVFGMFLRAMAGPTGTLISAAALTKVEMYASFIGVIINILLNLILIPTIGLIGAAIATVTSYTMYNIFELYFVYHILGHWPIPKDVIKPTLIISVFSGFILYVVESLSISYNISNIVLISAIVGSCALFTIYITQSITESDRKALRELMP
ncbi:MAG: polysaccharide biosynthesis C-terminal domain-containing protein, partial [Candidatus Paceibacteria bacterium]